MQIHQATSVDIDDLTLLFDAYRQFYGQAAAPMAAAAFIAERLAKSESVIFLARSETGEAIGFAQLYPAFSSVAMKRMWYLNDLFVGSRESLAKTGGDLCQGDGRTDGQTGHSRIQSARKSPIRIGGISKGCRL